MSKTEAGAEKPNVPKLRFPGFTDPWEQRKLGEVASFDKGVGFSKNDFADEGEQLFHYGRLYTDYECIVRSVDTYAAPREDAVFSAGGEVVTPSSGETAEDIAIASAIVSPGIMLGGGLNIIHPCAQLEPVFLALSISGGRQHIDLAKRAQGASIVHLYNEDLAKSPLMMPGQISEQRLIGAFFADLDALITLRQRELKDTKELKKSLLQKMFPKEGSDVPELRFPGFTDPWEQRKLGEFLEVSSKKNGEGVFGREDVLSVSKEYGVVNQIEFQGRSYAGADLSGYGVLECGFVVYTKSPLKQNPYGIIKSNKGRSGIVSTLYAVYQPRESVMPGFIDCYFSYDPRLNNYLHPLVNKGAKNDMKVSPKNALKGSVVFPSLKEQCAIVNFFADLDALIALRQRELDHTKELKKALLQQMFV